jgi:hypothetical protein
MRRVFPLVQILALVLASGATACSDDDDPDPLDELLTEARTATEIYRDAPELAVAHGFHPAEECVDSPMGTMGYHYFHLERMAAPPNVAEPSILVYLPNDQGDHRLVAIEYFVPIMQDGAPYIAPEDQPPRPESIPPVPEIFPGHPFDGPMAGHSPEMPWHFDQHVWLYEDNPDGLFAPFNPAIRCP